MGEKLLNRGAKHTTVLTFASRATIWSVCEIYLK